MSHSSNFTKLKTPLSSGAVPSNFPRPIDGTNKLPVTLAQNPKFIFDSSALFPKFCLMSYKPISLFSIPAATTEVQIL
jgi:hypothetical protein